MLLSRYCSVVALRRRSLAAGVVARTHLQTVLPCSRIPRLRGPLGITSASPRQRYHLNSVLVERRSADAALARTAGEREAALADLSAAQGRMGAMRTKHAALARRHTEVHRRAQIVLLLMVAAATAAAAVTCACYVVRTVGLTCRYLSSSLPRC